MNEEETMGWETEFNRRFGFGIWDSRAIDGHRDEGISSSAIVEFIRETLAKREKEAEQRGRDMAVDYISAQEMEYIVQKDNLTYNGQILSIFQGSEKTYVNGQQLDAALEAARLPH